MPACHNRCTRISTLPRSHSDNEPVPFAGNHARQRSVCDPSEIVIDLLVDVRPIPVYFWNSPTHGPAAPAVRATLPLRRFAATTSPAAVTVLADETFQNQF